MSPTGPRTNKTCHDSPAIHHPENPSGPSPHMHPGTPSRLAPTSQEAAGSRSLLVSVVLLRGLCTRESGHTNSTAPLPKQPGTTSTTGQSAKYSYTLTPRLPATPFPPPLPLWAVVFTGAARGIRRCFVAAAITCLQMVVRDLAAMSCPAQPISGAGAVCAGIPPGGAGSSSHTTAVQAPA